jgi:O-antigen/teichoic acid export membrane protein
VSGWQGVEQIAIQAEDEYMGRELCDSLPPKRRSPVVNVIATYGTNVAGAVVGLVNVLIVSRALGPEGRGSVAFVLTMAMFVSQLSNLGVQSAVANFGGTNRRLLPALAGSSVALSLLLGGLAMGVVAGLVELFPAVGGHVDAGTRWIALGCVPILILAYYLFMLAQAEYRFGVMNVVLLLGPVGSAATNGILAATGHLSVRGAVLAWAGGQTLGLLVLVWYVHRRLAGFGRADWRLARGMVGFGVKTHAGQIGMVGNYRLDQWLLGSISGARALGLYSVAVAWAEVLFFLPNALATVQRPDLVRANRSEASRQASVGFRAGALLTLVSVVVLLGAAPFLCVTVFGSDFHGSIRDLRILALGAFGIAAIKQLGTALTSQNKPLLETAGILVAFAVTAVTDVLLIPSHADLGASIASTVSYSAGGLAMAAIFVRALGGRLSDLLPRGTEVRWFWTAVRARTRRAPATT